MASKPNGIRTFYTILLTQTFSMIGSLMTGFAIGIYLFLETGDVTPLGIVATLNTLARIVMSNVAGVVSDRMDRRLVMVWSDVGQAAATLALMLLFFADALAIWHVYVAAAISAAFGTFQQPAFIASVTQLVPDDHRDRANSIMQITGPAAGIIAPAAAGALYGVLSVGGIMVVDLLTFAVAMVVVFLSHIPRPKASPAGDESGGKGAWAQLTFGMRWLWRLRPLFYAVTLAMVANFFLVMATVIMRPYILTITDNSKSTLGIIEAVGSLGGVSGAILIAVWGGTRPRMKTILPVMLAEGILLALLGIIRVPVFYGLVFFLLMVGFPIINSLFFSMMQLKVPGDLQGRVFAAVIQVSMLIQPIGTVITGPLVDEFFEPAVGASGWSIVAPIWGDEAGAGMGLLISIAGILMFVISLPIAAMHQVRHLEAILPDYSSSASEGDAEGELLPDGALVDGLNEALPA